MAYPLERLDAICKVAREKNCKLHMDGARLFNAAAASGASPARIVRDFDTVSICLSKGLGAPVGSVLVGSKETLAEAHRWRKMFGGGMRQSGVIAAAGLYALENNVDRLHDDHKRARRLAEAVNEIGGLSVNLDAVQSNIVFIGVEKGKTQEVIRALSEQGVEILGIDDSTVRAVFHLHITDDDVEKAIEAFKNL